MNDKISPITPKKRYSCASEYATPKGSDDSDNSLYYSFTLSEDDSMLSKENSINGGQWTVSNSSSASRIPRTKTPLLRKVLQSNFTPRNKNNKRVSFSNTLKPEPMPALAGKIPKFQSASEMLPQIDSNSSSTYDLKTIKEHLPPISNEKSSSKPTEQNDIDDTSVNDSASDATDDLESDLHDTIIENPTSAAFSATNENSELPLPIEPTHEPINFDATDDSPQTSNPLEGNVYCNEATSSAAFKSTVSKENSSNSKTIGDVLRGKAKPATQTRNSAKVNRQRLANENRKTVLPGAKTRATTYKRRSSTYEPRKVDPRKSLSVLKHVVNKVTKSITDASASVSASASASSAKLSDAAGPKVASTSATTSASFKSKPKPIVQPIKSKDFIKPPRLTMVNQVPRVPIMSTRLSVSSSVRAQRRETKYSFTNFAISKASTLSHTTSDASSSTKDKFIKPSALPVRNSNLVKPSTATNGSKCQYCDKYFAKSHGMTTHLKENCEKIPASTRRQLLKKNDNSDEDKSKHVPRHRSQAQIDSLSKYSRFFTNLTNVGDGDIRAVDVENGLKNLRAELRKNKNAHTGIIRTPRKLLRCHICKKLFLDCVEYAAHSSNHPM